MSEPQRIPDQLRRARERLNQSIEEVHWKTGLSVDVLRGMEEGRFDLVEPVFTRMALREYAGYLGLDVEDVLERYDREYAVSPEPRDSSPPSPPSDSAFGSLSDLPFLKPVGLGIAGLLILLFLAVALFRGDGEKSRPPAPARDSAPRPSHLSHPPSDRSLSAPEPKKKRARSEESTRPSRAQTSASVDSPVVSAPAAERNIRPSRAQTSAAPERMRVLSNEPDASPESRIATAPSSEPARETADSEPARKTAEGTKTAPEKMPEGRKESVREGTAPDAGDAQASAQPSSPSLQPGERSPAVPDSALETPAVPSPLLRLEIEAVDSTWVEVKWDGEGVFDGIIPRGEKRVWEARDYFLVRSGRAWGLRYRFQNELLGHGRLGDPTKVLRFKASREGVVLLGADMQPLDTLSAPEAPADGQP